MVLKTLFNKPKYIIRLDDASHFSNLQKWNKIEKILDKYNIKPIVAVIPENNDESISYSEFNQNFWKLVQNWQSKGWSIAMHGYKHLFHYIDRTKLIFPFYNRSEFAGLTLEKQRIKIKKSYKIFLDNRINPKSWISPGHCIDELTLEAIKSETNIKIISDGIAYSPYYFKGFYFIPQQLWKLKKKYFGIWTVCLHPDTMSDDEIREFDKGLALLYNKCSFLYIDKIELIKRNKSLFDQMLNLFFWAKYELKIFVGTKKIK